MLLAAISLLALVQDSAVEDAVGSAAKAMLSRGFTYSVKVAADMPDSLPRDRTLLVGVPVTGSYHNGVTHANDGRTEIYMKNGRVAVKTENGWLPLDQYLSPIRQAIGEGFNDEHWKRGNVTQARKAVDESVRIHHLVRRADVARLTRVPMSFDGLRKIKGETYEGDLTDHAAFNILQGPFEELVKLGVLSFQNVIGVARITLKGGQMTMIHAKVAGKFSYYNDEDNLKRKGIAGKEVLVEFTKIGETTIEVPRAAMLILEKMD